jgi:hypothetical protein
MAARTGTVFFLLAASLFTQHRGGCFETNTVSSTSGENSDSPPGAARYDVKEIEHGIFQIGDVRIDKRSRTVSFPAAVNLRQGAMEYLLVTSWGKVHESILRIDTEPYRIHIAMLLLGAKGAGTNDEELIPPPAPYVSHPSNIQIPGDKISIDIRWNSNGKTITRRAEELVYNSQKKSRLQRGKWVYNGSFMDEKTFVAQREGSVISLITDPEALINNIGPGHDNDSIWIANAKLLPPSDVPLVVVIRLVKARK